MPKITSFINYKGGVGKTTIAVEVAASLAYKFHKKVLLVDLDPQTNATLSLMKFPEWDTWAKSNGSLRNLVEGYLLRIPPTQLLSDTKKALFKDLHFTVSPPGYLHLLPCHLELMNIDLDIGACPINRQQASILLFHRHCIGAQAGTLCHQYKDLSNLS